MNIWLIMLCGGLLTFGLRFSFIFLLGRFDIPDWLKRTLRFVPPAVLSAIIVPGVILYSGSLDLSLDNNRLLAGLAAVIAAYWTKNPLATILIGMAALILLQGLR
jgi:branched-subunit amino acid transport protein